MASNWEYSFAHLAWRNTATGDWSETDPAQKITLIPMNKQAEKSLQDSHDDLVRVVQQPKSTPGGKK